MRDGKETLNGEVPRLLTPATNYFHRCNRGEVKEVSGGQETLTSLRYPQLSHFKFSDRPNKRGGKTRGGKETLKMGVRKLLRYPVFALAPIW